VTLAEFFDRGRKLYLFAAMVALQKEPVKDGMFKAPGGRAGGVLIGGFGFVITLAALILACVPGDEVDNVATFYLTVCGVFSFAPFVYTLRLFFKHEFEERRHE
jgi:hypothetical protein